MQIEKLFPSSWRMQGLGNKVQQGFQPSLGPYSEPPTEPTQLIPAGTHVDPYWPYSDLLPQQ